MATECFTITIERYSYIMLIGTEMLGTGLFFIFNLEKRQNGRLDLSGKIDPKIGSYFQSFLASLFYHFLPM